MKITVFTGNQPRHIALIEELATIADEVYAIQECTTVFPGSVEDFFSRSEIMQNYFYLMLEAQEQVFGSIRFCPPNVRQLNLKIGDLNMIPLAEFKNALDSDVYVVFGSSYIKGELVEFLVDKRALNIHMGTSPYYRGSSCNFWALYDRRPDYVGATIHLLSKGLDSGPILFHALPEVEDVDPFLLGMKAVKSAHKGLIHYLKNGEITDIQPVDQDKGKQIRYSRNSDFKDDVASEFLGRLPTADEVGEGLKRRDEGLFIPVTVSPHQSHHG